MESISYIKGYSNGTFDTKIGFFGINPLTNQDESIILPLGGIGVRQVCSFSELYQAEYFLQVINGLKQTLRERGAFSCIGEPKKYNMFLYLHNCTGRYVLQDGREIVAENESFVYTSQGSQYSVKFQPVDPSLESYNDGINFLIWDSQQRPLFFSEEEVVVIHPSNPEHYRMLFFEISEHCRLSVQSPARLQSIFYGLLSDLSYSYRREAIRSKQFHVIEKGILYLEEDKEQNLSIPDIAALCNVSEIYFRRLFKEYAGMSPVEYKLHTRLSRARQYLTSENFSIREVAELSGFEDPAYFCRVFKEKTGFTPREYRAQNLTAMPESPTPSEI